MANADGQVSCPRCGDRKTIKNGRTRHGVQNFYCKECGRQFVADPKGRVPASTRRTVDRMLGEGFRVVTISNLTHVSTGYIYGRKKAHDK